MLKVLLIFAAVLLFQAAAAATSPEQDMAWVLKSLCLLLIFVLTQAAVPSSQLKRPDDPKVTCPDDFFHIGSSCYFFSGEGPDDVRTFDEASDICEAMIRSDTMLAVMGSDYDEFAVISDFIVTMGIEHMFVGLQGPGATGNWTWLDGTSLSLSSSMWGCAEPVLECGGFEVDEYDLAPRVYLSSFDCGTATASYLCEYNCVFC